MQVWPATWPKIVTRLSPWPGQNTETSPSTTARETEKPYLQWQRLLRFGSAAPSSLAFAIAAPFIARHSVWKQSWPRWEYPLRTLDSNLKIIRKSNSKLNLNWHFHPNNPGLHEVPNGYPQSDRVPTPQRQSLRSTCWAKNVERYRLQ